MHRLVVNPASQNAIDQFVREPAHAALLTGAVGIGKSLLAADIAAQLLGVHTETLASHAYYRIVSAEKGVIAIEQVRKLISFFRLAVPGKAEVKRVAVIQDADAMGTEAQNALLKLLEEPPEGSVLLLTTSRLQALLPTIRSRLQIIAVHAPEAGPLGEHFAAKGYARADIQRALLRSGANVAEAEKLLADSSGREDSTLTLIKHVLGGKTYDRLLLVDGLAKQKEQAAIFVDTLLQVATVSLEASANRSEAALRRWHTVLQAALTAHASLLANGNTKLVLTDLMLSL